MRGFLREQMYEKQVTGLRPDRNGRNLVSDDGCAGDAASYGPKTGLVLRKPVEKHGSEVADRSLMTSAEAGSDLD